MKNFSSIYYIALLGSLFIVSSCKKLIEIDLPKDELTTAKVFADSTNINAAIVGIYYGLAGGSGAVTTYSGLSADELYPSSTSGTNIEFYQNALIPTSAGVGGIWSNAYSSIYKTNAVIESLTNNESTPFSKKEAFLGEVRAIRAFIYFNLVNVYGPVPLVLSIDYNYTKTLPRASEDEVYKQIIEDLKYAKSVLPLRIDGNIRVNKDAATGLLSRVYLYRQNYNAAIAESTELISSNRYTLATTPNDVFIPQSTETIWGLASANPANRATLEAFDFIPSSSTRIPTYVISDSLFKAFETDDLRKSQWIKSNTVSGNQYPYPYKYKMRTSTGYTDLEKLVMLRLAEQYLIRAEAEARLNTSDFSGAEADINKIRRRAGLPDFSAGNDQSLMLSEIEKQRQLELMCERGQRWFDLKRTKRATEVLSPIKLNWKATATFYPIPQQQIDRNPFLVQNDGY